MRTEPLTSPAGYDFWTRQLDLLGDREPLGVLAQTPDALAMMVAAYPGDVLRQRPFSGKWTPCEIFGHLVDIEWVFGFRIRTALFDEAPVLMPVDQDRWVAGQRHNETDLRALLTRFQALRAINLDLWRALPTEALARTAHHREADVPLSTGQMLRILAGHDLYHLHQMKEYVKTIRDESRGRAH